MITQWYKTKDVKYLVPSKEVLCTGCAEPFCGGLNRNGSYRLLCLNALLGGVTLLDKVCHCGSGL